MHTIYCQSIQEKEITNLIFFSFLHIERRKKRTIVRLAFYNLKSTTITILWSTQLRSFNHWRQTRNTKPLDLNLIFNMFSIQFTCVCCTSNFDVVHWPRLNIRYSFSQFECIQRTIACIDCAKPKSIRMLFQATKSFRIQMVK